MKESSIYPLNKVNVKEIIPALLLNVMNVTENSRNDQIYQNTRYFSNLRTEPLLEAMPRLCISTNKSNS